MYVMTIIWDNGQQTRRTVRDGDGLKVEMSMLRVWNHATPLGQPKCVKVEITFEEV